MAGKKKTNRVKTIEIKCNRCGVKTTYSLIGTKSYRCNICGNIIER